MFVNCFQSSLKHSATPYCVRQAGSGLNESFRAAAAFDDNSVVLAGLSRGNWSGVTHGEMDFIAVKLDPDGQELWRWQVTWLLVSVRRVVR